MSALSYTSCGMLGESFVLKDELRTSQVCVYCSQIVNLGQTRRHSLGVQCSLWQRQGSGGFIMSVFRTERVQNIIRLLLSTIVYRKLVLLQWTGTAQSEDDQFAHCNLLMFYSILRRFPLQAPACLVTQSVIVFVWNIICKEKPCPFRYNTF